MWRALDKLGVPAPAIGTIRSFHEDMQARVQISGELLEEIPVENGLQQGCTLAPTLFNLYACLMVEQWLVRVK